MEELWALSHAKFLLQHIRIRHDLLWHDIKKQFCFFLYPELNEGFIFHLWLKSVLITMYLFQHLCCIMRHCLYSSAARNPLTTWYSEVFGLYLLGFFSFPLISLLFPLSVTRFWQLSGAFPWAERAEQQPQQRGCPQPCARCPVAVSPPVADPNFHGSAPQQRWAALNSPNKTVLCFSPSSRESPRWRRSFGKGGKIDGSSRRYLVSVVSPFQCGRFLARLGFFTPQHLCCRAFV